MLDCLRTKDGLVLQKALWATGAQFQPVIDNITIFGECVPPDDVRGAAGADSAAVM
jgi:hypothetical protein